MTHRYLGITALSALLTLTAITTGGRADDATLLPNAIQYFMDANGKPLANGKVFMYTPSTTTPKTTWTTADKAVAQPQPFIPLGISGKPANPIYGDGSYRQKVVDQFNNTIWDFTTASTGGSGGGGTPIPATGDGNLVGTVLPWSGWNLPNQYLFADGHTVSRTTYPELLSALTHTLNAICTSGLPTLSGIPFSSTFNVPIGASVEASCIPPGSTVVSKATNSLTMSANATVSTAVSAQVFFYGDGDRSTTFNLPDLRSSVVAGPDAMDTTVGARAVLIPPYFPQNGIGAASASPFTTLLLANLPPITPAGTITNGAITNTVTGGVNGATATNTTVAAAGAQFLTGSTPIVVTSAQATSTFTGSVGGGSSTPISVVQPTIMLNYIIKVTPDANSATATGVLSLGGMTGALACGTGILCTGNTVSLNGTPVASAGSATIGGIAFWLDTAATTIGGTPGYITANPGNASIFSKIANPTNGYTTTFNGFQFSQGTPIPVSEQYGGNVIPIQQSVVATGVIAAGDTGISNTLAGYCRTDAPDPAICVATWGQSGTSVANSNLFAFGGVAQNIHGPSTTGFDMNYLAGMELDVNLWQKSPGVNPTVSQNHFYGINIQGGGNHTNEIGSGIVINNSAFGTPVPITTRWATGLELFPGCCVVGVSVGPVALGNSQDSAPITFTGKDSGGTTHSAQLKADLVGNLALNPATGSVVFMGDPGAGALLSVSSAFGSSGVRINNFTTAGVITNSITTGQLNSISGGANTVLHGNQVFGAVANADLTNSATTVNGQTCTLGSTCTISASATSITVGTTTVTSGAANGILFDSAGGLLQTTPSANNAVAVTGGTGIPTISTTLPTGLAMQTPISINLSNATALPTTALMGVLQAAQEPAHTGDVTNSAGSLALSIAANAVTLAKLATQATNTALVNATAGSAVPTAGALPSCSANTSALSWTTNSGFGCNNSVNAGTLGGATFASPVSIGGGTPGTGAFTTLSASTSLTTPLHIGGTGTAQSETYQTTTGVGTTGADHIFLVGNNGATQAARMYNSGAVSLGGSVDSGAPGKVSVVGVNSFVTVTGTTDGVSNATALQSVNSTAAVNGVMVANEPSRSTVRWGFAVGNWAEIGDFGGSTNGLVLGVLANKPMVFGTNSLERARMSAAGGFSIGSTTDPGAGGLRATGATIQFPALVSDTAQTDNSVCVNSSGTLLKGTGTLGICLGTSSARFKQDIVSMGAGLAEIVQLSPKNFFYKKGWGDDNKRQQYGLIAEDVVKVLPGITTPDKDGKPQAVDLLALVPILVNAVKQLKSDNDNLRMDVLALQAKASGSGKK